MSKLGRLFVVAGLCAFAGTALADGDSGDSSMNPYTGDSWAALQGGGHNLGEFKPTVTVRISKRAPAAPEAARAADERVYVGAFRSPRTKALRDDKAV